MTNNKDVKTALKNLFPLWNNGKKKVNCIKARIKKLRVNKKTKKKIFEPYVRTLLLLQSNRNAFKPNAFK